MHINPLSLVYDCKLNVCNRIIYLSYLTYDGRVQRVFFFVHAVFLVLLQLSQLLALFFLQIPDLFIKGLEISLLFALHRYFNVLDVLANGHLAFHHLYTFITHDYSVRHIHHQKLVNLFEDISFYKLCKVGLKLLLLVFQKRDFVEQVAFQLIAFVNLSLKSYLQSIFHLLHCQLVLLNSLQYVSELFIHETSQFHFRLGDLILQEQGLMSLFCNSEHCLLLHPLHSVLHPLNTFINGKLALNIDNVQFYDLLHYNGQKFLQRQRDVIPASLLKVLR